MNLQYFVNL